MREGDGGRPGLSPQGLPPRLHLLQGGAELSKLVVAGLGGHALKDHAVQSRLLILDALLHFSDLRVA
jgi:hypothetical protein